MSEVVIHGEPASAFYALCLFCVSVAVEGVADTMIFLSFGIFLCVVEVLVADLGDVGGKVIGVEAGAIQVAAVLAFGTVG